MKKLILVIIGLCWTLNMAWAQGPHRPHKHHPKLSKEAKEELHQFHKTEIYPVKKAAHDKFLQGLNQEDLAFLDQKRMEEKALHEEIRELKKQGREWRESGKSREEIKAIFEPHREKRKAFMESMKPFMERHQELVNASMLELKAHKEDWKNQKHAILKKYLSEEEMTKMEAHRKKRGEKRAKHASKHKGDKKAMKAVRFVLWDGEMKKPRACKRGGKNCSKDTEKTSTSASSGLETATNIAVQNYPNPAITQTTLLLTLQETAKKVTITIADANGKQVWNKQLNKLDAGEHKIDVNLRKFTNGQYFYTVEVGEQQITKTLVVNK